MLILGIETSCDETAAGIVEDGRHALSNVRATSAASFANSGGVIPEEAARKQVESVLPVIDAALTEASLTKEDIDAIAMTHGPGLLGSLLVGTATARSLAAIWNKPLIPVHHTLGHLASTWLTTADDSNEPQFPVLTLSASGGHTDIWLRTSHTKGQLLGRTRDDAAGEAFDKGASMLGLPYPGGPSISKVAETGDPLSVQFPQPLKGDHSCDFSFSGLKTALKYTLQDAPERSETEFANLVASYQHALCAHLVDRIDNAIEQHPDIQEIHVVGGVSANTYLREMITQRYADRTVRVPESIGYCTDNAAMIASAGFFLLQEKPDAYQDKITEASLPLEAVVTN